MLQVLPLILRKLRKGKLAKVKDTNIKVAILQVGIGCYPCLRKPGRWLPPSNWDLPRRSSSSIVNCAAWNSHKVLMQLLHNMVPHKMGLSQVLAQSTTAASKPTPDTLISSARLLAPDQ